MTVPSPMAMPTWVMTPLPSSLQKTRSPAAGRVGKRYAELAVDGHREARAVHHLERHAALHAAEHVRRAQVTLALGDHRGPGGAGPAAALGRRAGRGARGSARGGTGRGVRGRLLGGLALLLLLLSGGAGRGAGLGGEPLLPALGGLGGLGG